MCAKTNGTTADRDRRFDSWKEIASYLGRDIRTAQRWEKSEDLPVHRHFHLERPTVYALQSELDEWLRGRAKALERGEAFSQSRRIPVWPFFLLATAVTVAAAVFVVPYFRSPPSSMPVLAMAYASSAPAAHPALPQEIASALEGPFDVRILEQDVNEPAALQDLLTQLHADLLLTVKTTETSTNISIHSQLFEVSGGRILWSRELSCPAGKASDLAAEIGLLVRHQLSGETAEAF